MDNPEQEIIERILAGNPQEFSLLVERFKSRVFNYIYRMINNYDSALELSQDVFLKSYASLDKYDPAYRFSTWIFRISANTAIDFLRKKKGMYTSIDQPIHYNGEDNLYLQIKDSGESPLESLQQKEISSKIEEAIRLLPEKYQELIILRHINDCSYQEISDITRLPLGTVKNRIFRAREALKQLLEEKGELT